MNAAFEIDEQHVYQLRTIEFTIPYHAWKLKRSKISEWVSFAGFNMHIQCSVLKYQECFPSLEIEIKENRTKTQ